MSLFMNAELGSDSSDEDFNPTESKECSDTEDSDDDNANDVKKKNTPSNKFCRVGGKQKTREELERDTKIRQDFENETILKKESAEKSRIDDLWADFKQGTSSKNQPDVVNKSTSFETDSIFNPKSVKNTQNIEIKKQVDRNKSVMDSIFEEFEQDKSDGKVSSEKENSSNDKSKETFIEIKKVYNFSGEDVEVTKKVDVNSKEGKKLLNGPNDEQLKRKSSNAGGLASIMNVIDNKKTKMTCLDKTKLDWNKFVDTENIKEELSTFNAGKDGFVEKQQFLERTDQRRFEIEREAREKSRKNFMK